MAQNTHILHALCLAITTILPFPGLCQGSRFPLKFLSTRVESSLVIGGSEKMLRIITRLDTLAADRHNTMDERGAPELWKNEVDKSKIHSAHRQDWKRAHTLGLGCIDVSHASTGYEPKVLINGSSTGHEPKMLLKKMSPRLDMLSRQKWSYSACWELLQAGTNFEVHRGIQRRQTFQ